MDIKNLNQMQLKDLKNLNAKQLIESFKNRPDIFINILLIVVTFCATIYFYNSAQGQSGALKTEVDLAQQKLAIVEELKKVEKQFNDFKESFPKAVTSDQFISKLSEIALKNNVQTVSFAQPQRMSQEFNDITVINFSVSSESYLSLLTFLSDIEKLPYALRLHKFSAFMGGMSRGGRIRGQEQNTDKNIIEVNFEVGLVSIKK